MIMLRQGDVLLAQIDALPAGLDEVAPERRGGRLEFILAHGEATGHAHSVLADERVTLLDSMGQGTTWLVVRGAGVELEHQEHRPLAVPPGCYRIVRQRTYDPTSEGSVAD